MPGQRRTGIRSRPGDDVEHALGQPRLAASRASVSVVSGVSSHGLMTTVQPAANAGNTFHTAICSG